MLHKDLDWLISRESISDLPVRYCDCVWRDDIEGLVALFAPGRCYLDLRSGRHNMDWLGAGFYEDEYVKIDSEWRFQLRKFTALRMEELPEGINLSL